jgi:hypothetical protein
VVSVSVVPAGDSQLCVLVSVSVLPAGDSLTRTGSLCVLVSVSVLPAGDSQLCVLVSVSVLPAGDSLTRTGSLCVLVSVSVLPAGDSLTRTEGRASGRRGSGRFSRASRPGRTAGSPHAVAHHGDDEETPTRAASTATSV